MEGDKENIPVKRYHWHRSLFAATILLALMTVPLQSGFQSAHAGTAPTIAPMGMSAPADDDGPPGDPTFTPTPTGNRSANSRATSKPARGTSSAEATATSVPRGRAGQSSGTTTDGSELVELYPGYPGYRGYVTGVVGVGDHACVEDLEAMDPSFDRAYEDEQNLRAARRLGIAGGPEDWTWENWLKIEAERGLPVTCYVCAMLDSGARQAPRQHNVRQDDPRLLLGTIGSSSLAYMIAADRGLSQVEQLDNYELRAMAHMVARNLYPNAPELLALAYEIMATPGGTYYDFRCVFMERGSYSPLPRTTHPADQEFQFYEAASVSLSQLRPMSANALSMQIEKLPDRWYGEVVSRGGDMMLGEYWYQETGYGYCD
jgi:hypothetical protein